RRSPMIPDPTTAARSRAVPTASPVSRRPRLARSPPGGTLGGLAGADERAHEPVRDLGRDGVDVEPGAGQEVPRLLDPVDARRLEVDPLEARLRELVAIFSLLQRSRHAADPELDAPPALRGNLAAHDHVRYREAPARLQHPERLGEDAILVGREI